MKIALAHGQMCFSRKRGRETDTEKSKKRNERQREGERDRRRVKKEETGLQEMLFIPLALRCCPVKYLLHTHTLL